MSTATIVVILKGKKPPAETQETQETQEAAPDRASILREAAGELIAEAEALEAQQAQ
jgi:hypothetical protein